HHKRDLPWRNTDDPYIIWLSEIILQQTRVAQGLPYFQKYVQNYPSVKDLAQAPEEEVMRLWQGLGYYSRARNLHTCAKDIDRQYGGMFPDNYSSLLKLKGVGSYTAAAIASFAFGEPVAVVDGNVFRVLSRYFGLDTDIASPKGKKEFETLGNRLIPKDKPGEFNQAIMEFGALQCVPKNPDCESCPLKSGCFAYRERLVGELPVKIKKLKIKERYFQYAHIVCGEHVVLKQRKAGDIWQDLFDFPLLETSTTLDPNRIYPDILNMLKDFETKVVLNPDQIYKHVLTHQRIFANFVKFVVEEAKLSELQKWANAQGFLLVDQEKLESLAKPRLILKYLYEEK
ncbi:MAG: A/G-specific adenine glycosylase, partial [Cyclobacteriaceae bacterium]|nr:A/G-specific adenine glycosylase [Cyclobacteriaceae bacterium]